MDLNRSFERAIKFENRQKNTQGVEALTRMQQDYLALVAQGIITTPGPKVLSPVAERFRELRGDLTQEEVAQKAGVALNTLQKLEGGSTKACNTVTFNRLSRALGLTDEQKSELMHQMAENTPDRRRGPRRRS